MSLPEHCGGPSWAVTRAAALRHPRSGAENVSGTNGTVDANVNCGRWLGVVEEAEGRGCSTGALDLAGAAVVQTSIGSLVVRARTSTVCRWKRSANLQRAREADRTRLALVLQRRGGHGPADQVVGQQVRPDFFAHHRWRRRQPTTNKELQDSALRNFGCRLYLLVWLSLATHLVCWLVHVQPGEGDANDTPGILTCRLRSGLLCGGL